MATDPELERLLELRLDQIDRLEGQILDSRDDAESARRQCMIALRSRVGRMLDDLPWRKTFGGQEVVDRSTPENRRRVRLVRRKILAAIAKERETLAAKLLPSAARDVPLEP